MKLKILYRKNLGMSSGKIAAQAVHAALAVKAECTSHMPVVVLGVSDTKFEEKRVKALAVIKDAGVTEVAPGTETCMVFFENDPP